MRTKNLLVVLAALVAVVLVATSVVSAKSDLAANERVYINGIIVNAGEVVSVEQGETISIRVVFDALENESNVRVEAEIDGYDVNIEDETSDFVVESGKRYSKALSLRIPHELDDDLSEDAVLEITVNSKEFETEFDDIDLRVQRVGDEVMIMSASTLQYTEAGQLLPVDVVLKNVGYNDLDDLFVRASIPSLGVERTAYFGDLVALECDDDDNAVDNYGVDIDRKCDEDDEETVAGRLYLQLPMDAEAGLYTVEVEAMNDEASSSDTINVQVTSDFTGEMVISTVSSRTVAVGEDAEYSVLIVNPSDSLMVYRIVPETTADLTVTVSESVVAIPAGSSKTVGVTAVAAEEGSYNFGVNVFSGESLVGQTTLNAKVEGDAVTTTTSANPVVVLTVVLAIIFVVLLIVLLVLIGKKPEKSEEFGESYY